MNMRWIAGGMLLKGLMTVKPSVRDQIPSGQEAGLFARVFQQARASLAGNTPMIREDRQDPLTGGGDWMERFHSHLASLGVPLKDIWLPPSVLPDLTALLLQKGHRLAEVERLVGRLQARPAHGAVRVSDLFAGLTQLKAFPPSTEKDKHLDASAAPHIEKALTLAGMGSSQAARTIEAGRLSEGRLSVKALVQSLKEAVAEGRGQTSRIDPSVAEQAVLCLKDAGAIDQEAGVDLPENLKALTDLVEKKALPGETVLLSQERIDAHLNHLLESLSASPRRQGDSSSLGLLYRSRLALFPEKDLEREALPFIEMALRRLGVAPEEVNRLIAHARGSNGGVDATQLLERLVAWSRKMGEQAGAGEDRAPGSGAASRPVRPDSGDKNGTAPGVMAGVIEGSLHAQESVVPQHGGLLKGTPWEEAAGATGIPAQWFPAGERAKESVVLRDRRGRTSHGEPAGLGGGSARGEGPGAGEPGYRAVEEGHNEQVRPIASDDPVPAPPFVEDPATGLPGRSPEMWVREGVVVQAAAAENRGAASPVERPAPTRQMARVSPSFPEHRAPRGAWDGAKAVRPQGRAEEGDLKGEDEASEGAGSQVPDVSRGSGDEAPRVAALRDSKPGRAWPEILDGAGLDPEGLEVLPSAVHGAARQDLRVPARASAVLAAEFKTKDRELTGAGPQKVPAGPGASQPADRGGDPLPHPAPGPLPQQPEDDSRSTHFPEVGPAGRARMGTPLTGTSERTGVVQGKVEEAPPGPRGTSASRAKELEMIARALQRLVADLSPGRQAPRDADWKDPDASAHPMHPVPQAPNVASPQSAILRPLASPGSLLERVAAPDEATGPPGVVPLAQTGIFKRVEGEQAREEAGLSAPGLRGRELETLARALGNVLADLLPAEQLPSGSYGKRPDALPHPAHPAHPGLQRSIPVSPPPPRFRSLGTLVSFLEGLGSPSASARRDEARPAEQDPRASEAGVLPDRSARTGKSRQAVPDRALVSLAKRPGPWEQPPPRTQAGQAAVPVPVDGDSGRGNPRFSSGLLGAGPHEAGDRGLYERVAQRPLEGTTPEEGQRPQPGFAERTMADRGSGSRAADSVRPVGARQVLGSLRENRDAPAPVRGGTEAVSGAGEGGQKANPSAPSLKAAEQRRVDPFGSRRPADGVPSRDSHREQVAVDAPAGVALARKDPERRPTEGREAVLDLGANQETRRSVLRDGLIQEKPAKDPRARSLGDTEAQKGTAQVLHGTGGEKPRWMEGLAREGVKPHLPQVNEQLARQIALAVRRRENHVRLQVRPPHLGSVGLEVTLKNRTLTLTMTTEHQAVKEMIASQIQELKESLQQHGVTMERIEIDVQHTPGRPLAHGQEQGTQERRQTPDHGGPWPREDSQSPAHLAGNLQDAADRLLDLVA